MDRLPIGKWMSVEGVREWLHRNVDEYDFMGYVEKNVPKRVLSDGTTWYRVGNLAMYIDRELLGELKSDVTITTVAE